MSQHVGRHRSQSFSAFGELADLAARTARPAAKASAVAVASGGIVASFAVPASANPLAVGSAAAVAPQPAVAAPAAAPLANAPAAKAPAAKVPATAALMALAAPQTAPAGARLVAAAVKAPAKKGDVNPVDTLGVLGFTAKKAAPSASISVARLAPVVTAAPTTATGVASRSATRSTAAPAAQAPAVNIPAPTAGIAAIAVSLLGIPYVYGGTSTGGFDCSGYTQYVYRMAGKSIPRTAEAQRAASTKVSNPVPGDLVFFGYPAFHAAIYAGPGKIYHASRPGTVTSLANFLSYGTVTYGRF